jgi:hypothetical protein
MKFADIKAGDYIVESCHPCHGPGLLRKVERVTNTQIIVNGYRYRKADGFKLGDKDSWRQACLVPATPELLYQIRQYRKIESAKRSLRELSQIGELKGNAIKLLKALPHIEAAIKEIEGPTAT